MWARCSDAWCFSARSWQAGFAAVLAPEGQLKPSLPRLADSVEELLWAPTTALGLAHDSAMQKSPLLNGALLRVRLVCVQTPVLSVFTVVKSLSLRADLFRQPRFHAEGQLKRRRFDR